MEKISGLVLDVFDDAGGRVLKNLYPSAAELPGIVKTAMPLSRDQLHQLPDDVFALVLRQGDTTLRKYACVDAGNTTLHVAYFLMTHDKLPVEAVKTAADNLITACGWYDIEPPEELKKLSTGNLMTIGRQRVWKDADGTTYGSDGTSWDLQKTADVTGTADMPTQFGKNNLATRMKTPLSSPKTAADMDHLVDTEAEGDADTILEQAFGIIEKNPEALPQVKKTLNPVVDVTDKEPPRLIEEKQASHYALPYLRRYPLDSYHQVKAASVYFDEHWKMLDPDDRHTYAVNLLQRATPMDIPVSPLAQDYGSTKYASAEHIDICVGQRIQLLAPHTEGENEIAKYASAHAIDLYKELLANRPLLTASVFARTLGEIDKVAGLNEFWDHDVLDPYFSTFQKVAEDDTKDTLVIGNEYMKVPDLLRFVATKPDTIRGKFSEDFLEEMQADPVGIFQSMPMDQRLVIMHMVNGAVETSMS